MSCHSGTETGVATMPISWIEQFINRVSINEGGHWLWSGTKSSSGYGKVAIKGKRVFTHRVMYELTRGKIEQGKVIDHLCRVTSCCNPKHIELVTPAINAQRAMAVRYTKMITHCKHGHEYTEDNTVHRINRGKPARQCRICKNAFDVKYNKTRTQKEVK